MTVQSLEGVPAIRSIRYIIVAAVLSLFLMVTAALVVWIFLGLQEALLAFAVASIVLGAHHFANIYKLVRRLRTPVEMAVLMPVPAGCELRLCRDEQPGAEPNRRQQHLSTALSTPPGQPGHVPRALLFLSNNLPPSSGSTHQGEQHFGPIGAGSGDPDHQQHRPPAGFRPLPQEGRYEKPLT